MCPPRHANEVKRQLNRVALGHCSASSSSCTVEQTGADARKVHGGDFAGSRLQGAPAVSNVHTWHFASFTALHHFGRFRRIADIGRNWREMAWSLMTHKRH